MSDFQSRQLLSQGNKEKLESCLSISSQFLGSTEVDQPKGIEVVKEGIRKLKVLIISKIGRNHEQKGRRKVYRYLNVTSPTWLDTFY